MNYQESIKHNQNCWEKELAGIDKQIITLAGKKEALAGVVECLQIIEQEQKQQTGAKTIYIAGKVTGEDKFSCAAKFEKAKQEIEALGFAAINPLEVVGTWHIEWQEAMKLCIRALLKCDAIYFLPCANKSKGAKIELDLARYLSMPTYNQIEKLK